MLTIAEARARATADLEEYVRRTADVEGARPYFGLMDQFPDPFARDGQLMHITASAIVLSSRGVLLHKHRREGKWLQPGGHVDAVEAPSAAAERETLEETGIRASGRATGSGVLGLSIHQTAAEHTHFDICYLLFSGGEPPRPPEGESQEVAWFPLDEALRLADSALQGAIRSASRLATVR